MNTTMYYTKTELKVDGWTDAMIKRFLPEPDKTYPNPRYRKAAPLCLYDAARIEEVKKTEAYKDFKCKSNVRKESAKKAVESKRKKIIDWVNGLIITIPDFDKEVLIKEACEHFNLRLALKKEKYEEWEFRHPEEAYEDYLYDFTPDFSMATPKSDKDFLARISTNYLRHECTTYDSQLNRMFGKTGKDIGHDLLQARINEAIHRKYPWTIRDEESKSA